MKKLFTVLMLLLVPAIANAQAILENPAPYYSDSSGSLSCISRAPYCYPHQRYWNRSKTKIIAEYQPSYPKIISWVDMGVWRIGNAQTGLTAADYQDINDAIAKIGVYRRWGICWPGSHPATICLN